MFRIIEHLTWIGFPTQQVRGLLSGALTVIELAHKQQVGELFNDGNRIRNATRPKGIPDGAGSS